MRTPPRIALGNTGLRVSPLCMGTGTHGWSGASDQTRRGDTWLPDLLVRAQDLGINFWDLADQYGSHAHARRALQQLEREDVVIITKTTSSERGACAADIDRFLEELGTEYVDIVLLHGLSSADWPSNYAGAMETLSDARSAGRVRAVGISCHGLGALGTAATHPWVDVILARLNYAGDNMDSAPEEAVPLVHRALDAGKGLIGMKVLGCGSLAEDLRTAISWVFASGQVHAITVGFARDGELEACAALVEEIHAPSPP